MKKIRRPVLLSMLTATVTAAALAGCGEAPTQGTSGQSAEQSGNAVSGGDAAGGDVKACMVAGLGGLMDKSFNQSGYEGLTRAEKELGVQIAVVETFADSDYEPSFDNMIQEGCDLIVGVSFMMADVIDKAAEDHPEVKFALVDSTFPNQHDNARGIVFDTAEAAYLAGYAAADLTETGKVGTFLGGKIAPTMLFADGFVDGVAKYNEVHDASVQVLGWDKEKQDGMATGNFDDISKGKQYAQQLIEQGVDIILPVAGVVSTGALSAAQEAGETSVIWVDVDGYNTETDYQSIIVTSVMKEIGNAVYDTIESVVNGEFDNTDYVGGLANGGVDIAPWHDFEDRVTPELQAEIDQLKQDIIDGTIVVESPSAP